MWFIWLVIVLYGWAAFFVFLELKKRKFPLWFRLVMVLPFLTPHIVLFILEILKHAGRL